MSPAEREPVRVSRLGRAVHLSVGIAHSCAVVGDGSVWCWGRNDSGELGDGSKVARASPVRVRGLTDVREVSAGGRHTCAVRSDGSVWCWGGAAYGQLGSESDIAVSSPVEVAGLQPARRVVAGHEHTCALDRGGGVWCWGNNRLSVVDPLAHEPTVRSPRLLALPDVAESVAAGLEVTCATLSTGRVVCWGRGRSDLFVLGEYQHLSASSWATCGVRDAAVWCWSADFGTPRGNLPSRRRQLATEPPKDAFEDLEGIAAGDDHACATTHAGDVFCWGANDRDQLGQRGTADTPVPIAVPLPRHAEQIVAGAAHTCVLDERRRVYCWGDDRRGQLGPRRGPGPVRVPLGGRAHEIAAHGDRTCAELQHGQLRCWGNGQARPTTLAVVASATGIAVGGRGVCATDLDGRIQCWFDDPPEHWTWSVQEVDRPFVGEEYVCGMLSAGDLACWGDLGRLGAPPGRAQPTESRPRFVAHGFGTEQADASATHVCLIRRRAGVHCWGSVSVAPFHGLGHVRPRPGGLAVGNDFTCVIGHGRGVCWGRNDHGQLGGGAAHDLPFAHWIVDPRKRRE